MYSRMQQLLQTPLRRIFAAMFMIALTVLSACKDDDGENLPPVTVQFPSNGSVTIAENAAASTINLALSGAAPQDGTISISATSNAAGALGFNAEISVTKGNTVAILNIDPTDNASIDGGKVIVLTISKVTDGFTIGDKSTYTVNIVDDEGPTTANFSETEGSISEADASGKTIVISLTPKATATGTVTVTIDPATAKITTTPAATAGAITLPVAVGDEEVSFSFIPVNDENDNGGSSVKFTLSGSEGVQAGASDEYALTIADDDAIVPVSIADVREYALNGVVEDSVYIKGVITSSAVDANVAPTGLYIQDATGAIPVFFDAAHNKARGKEVLILLRGAKLEEVTNLLEFTGAKAAGIIEVGDGTLPTPKTITIGELNSGDFESQLVQLENVMFPDADGIITMNGVKTVSDGENTGTVFTRTAASFQAALVPLGHGTLIGLASDFTSGPQLLPQVAADIFANEPDGTIELSSTADIDFGAIANGATSTSTSYTVTGTGLTNEIAVSALTGYKVSSDNETFASAINLPSTGGTVYVLFAPTSGLNGSVDGTITHKSMGAATVIVNVKGEETGNGATTTVFTEEFEYDALKKLTENGYTVSSGGGTNPLTVGTGNGLTYSGYPLAGGNGLALTTSGEDDYKSFTAINSGSVYMSFLVNLSAAQAGGDYFIGLSPTSGQTNYTMRVHAKSQGAGFVLGLKEFNETNAVYGTTEFAFGTTYLIVVKLTFTTGDMNDPMVLYVNPTVGAEPANGEVSLTETTKADQADVSFVTFRQGSAGAAPTLVIDGVRVSGAWADLFQD